MRSDVLANLARGLVQLIYPGRCWICGRAEADAAAMTQGVCLHCHRGVTVDSHHLCPHCAATVGPHTDTTDGCMECRSAKFRFDSACRLGPYDGLLRDAILRMKSTGGDTVAEVMGRIYLDARRDALRGLGMDVVIPIPLHWRRLWARGHNQAESLARELSQGLGLPCEVRWLRRVKPATQHVQSSASARRGNVRGAFSVAPRASLKGRSVLLVDDVMTTGSTLSEAAGVLKASGAAKVVAAILARR